MTTLSDARFESLRAQGFTGATSDMLLQWLQANGATSNAIPDAWVEVAIILGFTGNRNDGWRDYLLSVAPPEIGDQMNDLWLWFWTPVADGGAGGIIGGGGGALPAWAAASSTYMIDPTATTPIEPATSIHEFMAQAIGEGTPVFDTPAGLLLPDYEGLYHEIPEDTMPVHGSRVATNFIVNSSDMTDPTWNPVGLTVTAGAGDPFGGNNAFTFSNTGNSYCQEAAATGLGVDIVCSFWVRKRTPSVSTDEYSILVYGGQGGTDRRNITAYATTEWQKMAVTGTTTAVNAICGPYLGASAAGQEVDFYGFQTEVVSGHSNQNPSEYIETSGTELTKHLTNLNGNTLTELEPRIYLVTEAEGTPLQSGVDDPSLVNLVPWSRDLTQGSWFNNAGTDATYDQAGITGEPNTATRLSGDNSGTRQQWLAFTTCTEGEVSTVVAYVKKNASAGYYAGLNMWFGAGSNDGAVTISLVDGSLVPRSGAEADVYESEDLGNWFKVYIQHTCIAGNVGVYLYPSVNTDGSGAWGSSIFGTTVFGNVEYYSNSTIEDIRGKSAQVTEGTTGGTPTQIGQMPSLYAAPAATNDLTQSRDLTAGWALSNLTTTYDQVGITGEPNTASLLSTVSSSGSARFNQVALPVVSGNNTFRCLMKQAGNSDWVNLQMIGLDATAEAYFNLATGAVGQSTGATVEAESLGGGWHACYMEVATVTDLTGSFYVRPVAGDGSTSSSAGDAIIMGNAEFYANKTIAQVRGSAPIVTEGSAVTNGGISTYYDIANHDNAQGAYYVEFYDVGMEAESAGMVGVGNTGRLLYTEPSIRFRSYDGTTINTINTQWLGDYATHKGGLSYGGADMANNLDGTWSADTSYDGEWTAAGSTIQVGCRNFSTNPVPTSETPITQLTRNVQRWDLSFEDGKAKIDELNS